MKYRESKETHPLWLRICHWINVIATLCMIFSGWRIYNASPLFDFRFPSNITLGGWLGGALQWHFTFMWLFFINGAVYVISQVLSKRLAKMFFPISIGAIFSEIWLALKGKLPHDGHNYNMLQKIAYLVVVLDSILLLLSGLVLWKSIQFPLLSTLLGGYTGARYIHFFSMSVLVLFLIVHFVMVLLVPRSLIRMIRGK